MLLPIINRFKKFRDKIFKCFTFRADATMELVDALAGNINARSVVQLCLNPAFRRQYGSVCDAITHFAADPNQSTNVEQCLIEHCDPITNTQPFRLFVLDCTAAPRKYAKALKDRGIVYAPNVVPGNKPITVGHQYSVMGFLPEQSLDNKNIPWILPLSTRRVPSNHNGIIVGVEQLHQIMPFFDQELAVMLGDSAYSTPKFINAIQYYDNAILIARLRSNRILNQKAPPKKQKITNRRTRGHEQWYGEEFKLKDETTWGQPTEVVSVPFVTRKGKQFTAYIQGWNELLMRQKDGIPLNEYPLRIIKITIMDEQNNQVYKRPMWLMVSGKHRAELTPIQIWKSYIRRYDVEHFFKFGKMNLLMDKFQTPDVTHEESWWKIVSLAYAQLYMARELAIKLPTPWEKYLPEMKNNATITSAKQVQKSFGRITMAIGTPAAPPISRGKQLGRQKGAKQIKRMRYPIIFKGTKNPKKMII